MPKLKQWTAEERLEAIHKICSGTITGMTHNLTDSQFELMAYVSRLCIADSELLNNPKRHYLHILGGDNGLH